MTQLTDDLDELSDMLHAVNNELEHVFRGRPPSAHEDVKELILRVRAAQRIRRRFAGLVNVAAETCRKYVLYEEFDPIREVLGMPLYMEMLEEHDPDWAKVVKLIDWVQELVPDWSPDAFPRPADLLVRDGLYYVRWSDGSLQALVYEEASRDLEEEKRLIARMHGALDELSGQTATESETVPVAMDTDQTVPWTPEEPGPPEPPSAEYTLVWRYLDGMGAEPDVRDAFNALMGRLNTAEDELALERLRADSAVGTARALRDRAERVEAAVEEALTQLAHLAGGDSMETPETPQEPTPEPTPTEDQPQPGEQTAPSEDGPAENDPA